MERTVQVMSRTKLGEFCWVDLVAKDLEGETAFYESLFGWVHRDQPTTVGPLYRMFLLDGAVVAAASEMSPEMKATGMPSMWNTYIAAPNVDDIAKRAEELGAKIAMPAMDVMDQGRMVAIQDPTGATVFFWQAGSHKGAERFGQPGSLMWNDLATRDPEKAATFYRELLGWEIEPLTGGGQPYWQVSVSGQPEGGIMPMPENMPAETPANWLAYFGVSDTHAACDKARGLGGKTLMEPMEVGDIVFCVLSDPAGAVFAVMQPLTE